MISIKILIIGIVASGKTTLARRFSIENNIKYYEIDSIVHDDLRGVKRTVEEQIEIIKKINKNKDWIIEGTLRKNLDILLEVADRIVFIDIPLRVRKVRIMSRYLKQKLGIEKCNYKPTLDMVHMMYKWTEEFEDNKDEFLKRINKYEEKLIRLDTVLAVDNFSLN